MTAAGALIAGPETDGSYRYPALVVPSIDARFADGWFAGVINGEGDNFSTDPGWDLGLRLGVYLPRDDQDLIAGLDDIPLRVTAGAFGNIDLVPNKLPLRSALPYGSNGARSIRSTGSGRPLARSARFALVLRSPTARWSAIATPAKRLSASFTAFDAGSDAALELRPGAATLHHKARL